MTMHFANFIAGIRKGEKLNAPVAEGNVAVTMLQLSNVAWEAGCELQLDPGSGQPRNDPDAMKLWLRNSMKKDGSHGSAVTAYKSSQ